MRILLSIGCDTYLYPPLTALNGAENDAARIFNHLVTAGWGDYDPTHSKLLRSPTLQQVRDAISDILFTIGNLVEFTFFFAGHGGVKDGAYFLCVRDTMVDRLSMSALSMTQLFAWVSEAGVAHTNIVADACESGGVVHDIATLLNPNVIGKAGSISLSLLAASGSDQYASEINGGGACTNTLLSCLRGDIVVQTTRPTFDLVEIGKVVSNAMKDGSQTPVYWGINLYGQAQFAKNPAFETGIPKISATIDDLTRSALADDFIKSQADEIWKLYLSIGSEFDAEPILAVLEPICRRLSDNEFALASFVSGIASTFGPRVNQAQGGFGEAQLYATCLTALLQHISLENDVDRLARELARKIAQCVDRSSSELLHTLRGDKYALLDRGEGFAGLYFLPIRVLRILGWIGAAAHASAILQLEEPLAHDTLRELVRFIVDEYSQSIVAISDEQTPFFVSFVTALDFIGYTDEVESVTGYLFNSLCEHRGCISVSGLSGKEAFDFLNARIEGRPKDVDSLVSRPQSLLPSLLLTYESLDLADVPDQAMINFDRIQMNLFVPDSYRDFGLGLIEGINHSYQVGHSVWKVADLNSAFASILERISADAAIELPTVQVASLMASLVRPNREAWFLFLR